MNMEDEIFEPEVEEAVGEPSVETEVEAEPQVVDPEPAPEPEVVEKAESQPQNRDNDFARMRKSMEQQFQSSAEYKLAKKLADKYGTSVEDIVQQLEDQELQEQAQREKTTPEHLKRLNAAERRQQELESQVLMMTLERQIQDFKGKNADIPDQDLIPAVQFLGQAHRMGMKEMTIEQAFKATNPNYETNLRERIRQEILAEMTETKAPIVTKGSSPDQGPRTANDLSDADFDKLIERVKRGERITNL